MVCRHVTIGALAAAFFITALLYSSVGFGGGSTYNALLALAVTDIASVPIVALLCNIIVVTLGSWKFIRGGHLSWNRFWPLAILSVPAAIVGGYLPTPVWLFVGLLAVALAISGLLMLWNPLWREGAESSAGDGRATDLASGASLGLLAGITGIGGGIYLSPLLHLRRWGTSKAIAGTCATFILVNSIGGLVGQLLKSGSQATVHVTTTNWPLFPAVAVGGLIGSTLGSFRLNNDVLRTLTGLLVLYVAIRLGVRFPHDWANR